MMPIPNRLADLHPEITAWRRDLHQHPELQFDLPRTSALVAQRLREFGCDQVVTGVGRSGVVAVIRGREPGGRTIGFRADMDALPIPEATGADHASTTPGKMHACGHDGHTSMLLGAAKYLAETRAFAGTVVLVFQPAEEGEGGARAMVADGLMDRFGIQEIYGLHNMPGIPAGQFAIRPGPMLAAADLFEVTVTGKGGHGALPHLAVDPLVAASAIVLSVQAIVARAVSPLKSAVVSVCGIASESMAHNVISGSVRLTGTVRSFDPEVKALVVQRLRAVVEASAAAHGCTAVLTYTDGVLPTVNAPEPTEHAIAAARAVAGAVDTDVDPSMGAEDFSEMLAARPGAFILLGNGDSAPLHHPQYDFNDDAIPAGAGWFVALTEQRLPLSA
jgi:hippurate hydrolase